MLDFLKMHNIDDVICTVSSMNELPNSYKTKFIIDARSAVFYAMGIAQKKNKKVAVLITYEGLLNAYSPLIEAWFKHSPLCVILIENCSIDSLFYRCFENIYNSLPCTIINFNRPILIQNNNSIENETYEINCSTLNHYNIHLYHTLDVCLFENKNKETVFENSYGIISRFLGITILKKSNNVLICKYDDFLKDINCFNSKYLNENVKVVIICKNEFKQYQWLQSNRVKIYSMDDFDNFIKSKEASILILEKENMNVY